MGDLLAIADPDGYDYASLARYQAPTDAIDSYTRAIDFFESFPVDAQPAVVLRQSYGSRSLVRMRFGNFPRALEDADEAIRLGDETGPSFLVRATAHAQLKHRDEAVADLERALQIEGRTDFTLGVKARLRSVWRDYSGATETLEEQVKLFPQNAQAKDMPGLLRAANGDGLGHLTTGGLKILKDELLRAVSGRKTETR